MTAFIKNITDDREIITRGRPSTVTQNAQTGLTDPRIYGLRLQITTSDPGHLRARKNLNGLLTYCMFKPRFLGGHCTLLTLNPSVWRRITSLLPVPDRGCGEMLQLDYT